MQGVRNALISGEADAEVISVKKGKKNPTKSAIESD
jgi:hypothetical protein